MFAHATCSGVHNILKVDEILSFNGEDVLVCSESKAQLGVYLNSYRIIKDSRNCGIALDGGDGSWDWSIDTAGS